MDFEIDEKGVLHAYHGKAKHVVIPDGVCYIQTSGVFDKNSIIESIFLPKSFVGYIENRPEADYFEYEGSDGKLHLKQVDCSTWGTNLNPKSTRKFRNDDLPYLKSYEVDPNNKRFACRDGVLYNKNFTKIVDCPRKYSKRLVFDESLQQIDREAFGARTDLLELEFTGEIGNDFLIKLLADKFVCVVKFYALNLLDIVRGQRGNDGGMDGVVFIWPKVSVDHLLPYHLRRIAMGMCYEKDLFRKPYVNFYEECMREYEEDLLRASKSYGLTAIADYYETLWQKWNLRKLIAYNGGINEHVIQNCVLHGSLNELKFVLDQVKGYYLVSDVLFLALRYAGFNKVKCILEHDGYSGVIGPKGDGLGFRGAIKIGLMVFSPLFKPFPFMMYGQYHLYSYLGLGKNGEFHSTKVVSEQQRIRILKYCIKHNYIVPDLLSYLCFSAYIVGAHEIAAFLTEKGYSPNVFIAAVKGQKDYESYLNECIKWAAYNNREGLIELLELLEAEDHKLVWQKFFDHDLLKQDASITELLIKHVKITRQFIRPLVLLMIEENNVQIMGAILKAGGIKTKSDLDEYLQISSHMQRHEITTLILDYQESKRNKSKSKKSSLQL